MFRDFLRSHPDAATAYGHAKQLASDKGRLLAYSDDRRGIGRHDAAATGALGLLDCVSC